MAARLARRGYHLVNFEHVLGLELTKEVIDRAAAEYDVHAAHGIRVARASNDDGGLWLRAVATGFAHPDVFDILLQVMDHATLTDNNGRQSDFRHVVLIFTTNAGARDMTAARVGFGAGTRSFMVGGTKVGEKVASFDLDSGAGGDAKKAIERTFSPEFRNRMDGWIAFSSLPMEVVERIVDKQVDELRVQLKEKQVELVLQPAARKWLADKGFSPQFGARPMARLLQAILKKPLAERILFGDLEKGGKVVVGVQDDQLELRKE